MLHVMMNYRIFQVITSKISQINIKFTPPIIAGKSDMTVGAVLVSWPPAVYIVGV